MISQTQFLILVMWCDELETFKWALSNGAIFRKRTAASTKLQCVKIKKYAVVILQMKKINNGDTARGKNRRS